MNHFIQNWVSLILCYCAFAFSSFGQSIKGVFTDHLNSPLEYVKVIAYSDSLIMGGSYTDSLGGFIINLPEDGIYNIKATSFRGDTIYNIDSVLVNGSKNLGVLQINSQSELLLGEVKVQVKKPLIIRKPDRLIFNVENTITSSGGTILDALKITPNVRVRQNLVEIIGKSSVVMYMDGQPLKLSGEDLFNFLRSIPASDVKNIEVISNPPANFEAQGNSGVINIVTKSSRKRGLTGAIRAAGVQAYYPGWSTGASLNYSTKKFLCYGSINMGDGNISPVGSSSIYYENQTWEESMRSKTGQSFLNGRIGMDFKPSEKIRFGARYWGGMTRPRTYEGIKTTISSLIGIDSVLQTYSTINSSVNDHYINGFYQQNLDTNGRLMVLNVDYFDYKNSSDQTFETFTYGSIVPASNFYSYLNGVDQNIRSASSSLDFTLPFSEFDFSTGAKVSFIVNNSDINSYNLSTGVSVFDSTRSTNFRYQENTQAAYVNASKEFDKFEIQLGLRAEYTQTEGRSSYDNSIITNDYFQIFPTAYIAYAPSDTHYFDLNYGRRIDRPAYWRLNPFKRFNSSYSYSEGNPFLQPAFYDNIEFSYTYNDILTFGAFYSRGTSGFNEITYVSPDNSNQVTTQRNFLTTNSYGISISYYFNVGAFWESSNDISVYYNQSSSNNPVTNSRVEGMTAYVSTYNSFIFNKAKTFSGELSFYYQFPEVDGIDNFKNYYGLTAGLRWKLFKQKLNITCQMVDMLGSQVYTYNNTINEISQTRSKYWDTRQAVISLTYIFGKEDFFKPQNSSSNNAEKDRLNQ